MPGWVAVCESGHHACTARSPLEHRHEHSGRLPRQRRFFRLHLQRASQATRGASVGSARAGLRSERDAGLDVAVRRVVRGELCRSIGFGF